jgi:hypothetical protein
MPLYIGQSGKASADTSLEFNLNGKEKIVIGGHRIRGV